MEEVLRQIRWRGVTRGQVRALAAFNKKFHTVPDAATPATEAFLAKLVAPELLAEAEEFFQRTRAALGYKRREITLSAEGGRAVLETRDFTLEWLHALDPADPAAWHCTLTLSGIAGRALLEKPEFDALFAARFTTLEFQLTELLSVEAVIDAVEAAEDTAADEDDDGGAAADADAGDDAGDDASATNAATGKAAGAGAAASATTKIPASKNAKAAARKTEDRAAAAATRRAKITVEYPSNCSTCTLRTDATDVAAVFSGDALRMEFPRPGSPRELADEFARIRRAFDILGVRPR